VPDDFFELKELEVKRMATITKEIKELSKITSEEWKEWTMTVWNIANISDSVHPAVFPVEIPHRLLRMFSFWGETILDPFSGTGTTGEAALSNGRKYVGFETNSTYYERSTQRLLEVIQNKNIENANEAFVIHNHSCLDMASIPDNSIGAVITSPPYWNKADYGEYIGNIGGFEYYDDFIDSMESVVRECYRVLMPGRKLCIVTANVNQNTKEYGLVTIPIASDLTKIAQSVGFSLINQIIWNKNGTGGRWGSSTSQRPIFGSYPYPPNFLFKNVNEYIIIVQKPDPKKKNNSAPSYRELFRNTPR
jgi:site-specific DNA-methyltransferase (adenine-specific)